MIVYKATNIINQKSYVGWTSFTLEHRKERHFATARHNVRKYTFHKAIRKYGEDNFRWEVLLQSDDEKYVREVAEKQMIKEHRSHISQHGYNMTFGGDGVMYGMKHTEESRQKMRTTRTEKSRELMRLNSGVRGKPKEFSDLTKKRLSDSLKLVLKNTQKIKCPHCQQEEFPWHINQHHNDKCVWRDGTLQDKILELNKAHTPFYKIHKLLHIRPNTINKFFKIHNIFPLPISRKGKMPWNKGAHYSRTQPRKKKGASIKVPL